MRTVTVSRNWYSFPRCSGIAVPTVFGALSDVSCRDRGRACWAWSGLVGMEVELGHSLTLGVMKTRGLEDQNQHEVHVKMQCSNACTMVQCA